MICIELQTLDCYNGNVETAVNHGAYDSLLRAFCHGFTPLQYLAHTDT